MTKTLRVDLADLEGIPHASGPSGTSVVVTAEYTSPVVLESDGKIILSPKSKTMGAAGRVDFDNIYASDSEEVREDHRGFAVRVKVNIREPNGATRTWARTVKPLEYMADTIRLGRLPSAEGLPAQWVSVGEVIGAANAAATSARQAATDASTALAQVGPAATAAAQAAAAPAVTAAEAAKTQAQSAATSAQESATLAGQAQAAALEVPDANVSALIGNPVTDTRAALATVAAPVDVYPTGNAATDTANVIAAAEAAAAAGRREVRLADGHYLLDGVTVADIHDRYLVGDGATFSPDSWVYPFKTSDLNAASARKAQTTGRGRIAIELDDGLLSHWRQVFPLTKELGITLGTAWHTHNGAQWITEAHRHGWEVICHLPENITAVQYRDDGQLDAVVESSLDKIEEAIGTRKNLGFVYPQHVRDLDTDRILSKYFTYGRGVAAAKIYPPDTGKGWLTASYALDAQMTGTGLSDEALRFLDSIEASNGDAVFYCHHQPGTHATFEAGIRALVTECRRRGIDIVNPSQISATRVLPVDTYFEDATRWTVSSNGAASTEEAYHGTRSVKAIATTSGSATHTYITDNTAVRVPTRPGFFTVYRASIRHKNAGPVPVTSAGQGLTFGFILWPRKFDDPSVTSSGSAIHASRPYPLDGGSIPAGDWTRHQDLIYLPPSLEAVSPRLHLQNAAAGSGPIYLDEWRLQHIDYVAQIVFHTTMIGTGNVIFPTGIIDLPNQVVSVVPSRTPAGTITAEVGATNGRVLLKSTSAADTMPVKVVITPGGTSYGSGVLTPDGA